MEQIIINGVHFGNPIQYASGSIYFFVIFFYEQKKVIKRASMNVHEYSVDGRVHFILYV